MQNAMRLYLRLGLLNQALRATTLHAKIPALTGLALCQKPPEKLWAIKTNIKNHGSR